MIPTVKFSHCPVCGRCWNCIKPHVVMLDDRAGVGVLCIGCWEKLDRFERIRFHFAHWLEHAKWWERALSFIEWPVASWEQLKQAVESDAGQDFNGYCQGCGEFRRVKCIVPNLLPVRCPVCEHTLMPLPGSFRRGVNG